MARYTYMAQRAVSKAWLHRELPLTTDGPELALSAAGTLKGTLPQGWDGAYAVEDRQPVMLEWGTILHVDADGQHRGAFIVHHLETDRRGQLVVQAIGVSAYLRRVIFDAELSRVGIDPADIARALWAHAQSYPDGDLGVTVTGSTPVRLGTPKVDSDKASGPYELSWWETPNCGSEFATLADETPFDWVEEAVWDGNEARLGIRIGYPRIGRRRDDLAFVEGENIVDRVLPKREGEAYANTVIGLGSGEGKGGLRKELSVRDGRLRVIEVLPRKDVTSQARLDALTRAELARLQPAALTVDEITVRDHPSAPLGSWQQGDDIRVQVTDPHFGLIDDWFRVIAWRPVGEQFAVLRLARADQYSYGR